MEELNHLLSTVSSYVWSLPLVILLCGTGIFLTIALGFPQFTSFAHAFRVVRGKYDDPNDPGQITHFQALCTALSATVGLGNIAGVAVAIHLGGPGATFWMVLVGLIGMTTKYAEATLAVKYRKVDEKGEVRGGPMYYIEMGLGKAWKPMAAFYAIACVFGSMGAGNMFQSQQVASILHTNFSIPPVATGLVLAILTGIVIIGGIRRIGEVASFLAPLMGVIYVMGALVVVFANINIIPTLLYQIVHDAFTGTAAVGGFSGIALRAAITQGVRRACFSNEAGMGSASFAHSAAATKEPVREGTVALLGPFIDTVVICTMTALVILISGTWTQDLKGVELTAVAFNTSIPGFGDYFIPIAVTLFAFSTLLSWSYYGERSINYLFGAKGTLPYKALYCTLVLVGTLSQSIDSVLNFSDIMIGLMVIPNLIALLLLLPKLRGETKSYNSRMKKEGSF